MSSGCVKHLAEATETMSPHAGYTASKVTSPTYTHDHIPNESWSASGFLISSKTIKYFSTALIKRFMALQAKACFCLPTPAYGSLNQQKWPNFNLSKIVNDLSPFVEELLSTCIQGVCPRKRFFACALPSASSFQACRPAPHLLLLCCSFLGFLDS